MRSFVGSKQFEFLIGPEKTPCYIHLALVARSSKTLDALVTGSMEEAKRGSAQLPDIEPATFIRFTEFAYTGGYSSPMAIKIDEPSNATTTACRRADYISQAAQLPKPTPIQHQEGEDPKPNRNRTSLGEFASRASSPAAEITLWQSFQAAAVQPAGWVFKRNLVDRTLNFSPVFLAHAQLYAFGDQYDIGTLRILALQKLRCHLSFFTLHAERIDDVVDLLKYTYENTADLDSGMDALRDLVTDYVVCHPATVGKNLRFLALLEEPGKLARDVMSKTLALVCK